jgi:hypothetical protein
MDLDAEIINIPVRGGITEGGLIIIGIVLVILAILVLAIILVWRYGAKFASALNAVKAETKGAHEQVRNDHKINLRDDMDAKHSESMQAMIALRSHVDARFDTMNDRISGVDDRVNNLDTRLTNQGKV